ncbi:unnamed protein product [Gadus morhua 'NCC']
MAAENTHFCIHTASQPRVALVQPPALRRTHWGNPHGTQRATAPSTPTHPTPRQPHPRAPPKGARRSDGALSSTEPGLISGEPDRVKPSITGQLMGEGGGGLMSTYLGAGSSAPCDSDLSVRVPCCASLCFSTHIRCGAWRAQQHHYFQRKLRGARLLQNPVANVSWSLRHSGGQLPPGPDGSAGGHQDGPDSCSVTTHGPSHRGPRLLAPCLVAPLLVGPRAWWGPPSGGPRLRWSCSWLAPCLVGPGPGGILRVVAPVSGGPCICRGPGLAPDRSTTLSAWRIPTLTVKQQMTQGALEPAD